MMRALATVSALSVALLAGCPPARLDVPCGASADCLELDNGVCLPVESGQQWCAYPDNGCESGQRFSDFDVDPMYSGACVPPQPVEPPPRRCNPVAPFEAPSLLPNINSSVSEYNIKLTGDELTAFIDRESASTNDIVVSTRAALADNFRSPVSGGVVSAIVAVAGTEYSASPSVDGLTVYFHRQAPAAGALEVFAAIRPTNSSTFAAGSNVLLNGSALTNALFPEISRNGNTLYWADFSDLHSAVQTGSSGAFAQHKVENDFGRVNGFSVSMDELTLYYSTGAPGDIFVSLRPSKEVPFGSGTPIANINSPDNETVSFITADECFLYFVSNRPGGLGGHDLWVARRGV